MSSDAIACSDDDAPQESMKRSIAVVPSVDILGLIAACHNPALEFVRLDCPYHLCGKFNVLVSIDCCSTFEFVLFGWIDGFQCPNFVFI